MIIFSNSSVMASPDKDELKRIHIIFNKIGDDYDKLNSLFLKFSLVQVSCLGALGLSLLAQLYNMQKS